MIAMETNHLVDDYLRRLEDAAAHLQRSRRAELVSEIREHIESALRQEDAASEVAVRNVLERLGPPEEIVDAAEPPADPAEKTAGWSEIGSLLALIVPVIGWIVGMVLVFASAAWTRRDKLVALSFLAVLVLLPAIGVTATSGGVDQPPVPDGGELPGAGIEEEGSTDFEVMALVGILGMLAGLPSALYLGWRLRRHPTRV